MFLREWLCRLVCGQKSWQTPISFFCFRFNLIFLAGNASIPTLAGFSSVDYFPAMILVLICAKLSTLLKTIFDKML